MLKIIRQTNEGVAKIIDMLHGLQEMDGHNAPRPVLAEMPIIPQLHGRDRLIRDVVHLNITNSSPRVGL
jgi:hypothetical protein